MKNKNFIYTISMLFLLLDQLIKLIVTKNMELFQEIKIIKNFFSIYYIKNKGAAFSIMGNQTILLILISIICLLFLKNYIKTIKTPSKLTIVSLGIIIGGILGNLFDRLFYKEVIDYLSFNFFEYSFPVFNLADIGIIVGAVLLIITILLEEKNIKKKVE